MGNRLSQRTKLRCPCSRLLRTSSLRNAGVVPSGYLPIPICIMRSGALPTPPLSNGGAARPQRECPQRGGPSRLEGRGYARPARPDGGSPGRLALAETNGNGRRLRRRHAQQTSRTRQTTAEPTNTSRSSLHRRPTPPLLSAPPPSISRPSTPALRVASTAHPTHRSSPHRSPRLSASLLRLPPSRTGPPAPPPGLAHPVLPGRSRKGGQRNAVAPLPRKAQAGSETNTPGRGGGGLFALKANTKKRTPRNEPQETNRSRPGLG
jgi:hypothetical protein